MSSTAHSAPPADRSVPSKSLTIALVGNPNTGKSSLFNALSGMRQKVGNYPGVTVEKRVGKLQIGSANCNLIDLPGTYSLAARSPDEMIAVDLLLGTLPDSQKPDVILNIVDASNLERNLFLTTQLLDLNIPVVVALNMTDLAEAQGIQIDVDQLRQNLGLAIIPIQANKKKGMEALRAALVQAAAASPGSIRSEFPPVFKNEIAALQKEAIRVSSVESPYSRLFLLERAVIDAGGASEQVYAKSFGTQFLDKLAGVRSRLADAGIPVPQVEARTRYTWLRERLQGAITKPSTPRVSMTAKLDRFFMHRIWGTLFFLVAMFVVFQAIFVGAKPLMDGINDGKDWLGEWLTAQIPAGVLQRFLVQGVLGGVGSVLVFLPQIVILFGFIAILEDCGYMARAAFLMDKLMMRCGLSGKSFVPMLSSFACAIPGIMATRVIEDRRDRLTTILIAPLMSCTARLPVYSLLAAAFFSAFGDWVPGLVIFAMYLVGLIVAPLVAYALKRTVLRGEAPIFLMEMPPYKWPSLGLVIHRMFDRGWAFVKRAGTLILATMIVIWAALYFPLTDQQGNRFDVREKALQEEIEARPEDDPQKAGKEQALVHLRKNWQRESYLGQVGRFLEPAFEPLGWDWRITTAALASFPAREVIVGVMGILFEAGDVDPGEEKDRALLGSNLQQSTWETGSPRAGQKLFSIPVALGLMVFFALCCQCAATLAVIKRETNSWRWPVFAFTYMTVLAYAAGIVTYQVARLFA